MKCSQICNVIAFCRAFYSPSRNRVVCRLSDIFFCTSKHQLMLILNFKITVIFIYIYGWITKPNSSCNSILQRYVRLHVVSVDVAFYFLIFGQIKHVETNMLFPKIFVEVAILNFQQKSANTNVFSIGSVLNWLQIVVFKYFVVVKRSECKNSKTFYSSTSKLTPFLYGSLNFPQINFKFE